MTVKLTPREAAEKINKNFGIWGPDKIEEIITQCVKDAPAELLADARKLEGFVRQVNVIHGYEEGLDLLADWRKKYGEEE